MISCEKKTPYNLPKIEGKSFDFIIKEYGKPEYEYNFQLSDTLLEYRYGLLEKFPNLKDKIEIKELKFERNNETIFIWFNKKKNQWIVVSGLVVPEGIKI